ncbi:hypothetical protein APHAL10511_000417 [Amanita phalloides]|nr:hypothetical protein APHAL10511_000417 [Amanita phalloides]
MFASTEPSGILAHDPSSYLQTSVGTSGDPNSPETFRHNLQLVQQHTLQVQSLARSALAGIQNAYHPGTSPSQTSADLANLKQAIHNLLEAMRQSGVGALPVLELPLPTPSPSFPGGGTGADPSMSAGEMETSRAALDTSMNAGAGGFGGGVVPVQTQVPSEEKLMEDTVNGIKILFERQKRSQESAAVAANLLGGMR